MPHPSPLVARPLPTALDPETVFGRLAAADDAVFWLDAGAGAARGWSLIGVGEPDAAGPDLVRVDAVTPQEPGRPPFLGGWVGWLDYESGAVAAGAPAAPSEGGPAWIGVRRAVAFDHGTGRTWSLTRDGEDGPSWIDEEPVPDGDPRALAGNPPVHARHAPAEYRRLIDACREEIRAGRAYQLCLTTRFEVPGRHDALEVYRRLRRETPSHHGGFLRIGGRALLSASPEVFLRTEGDRIGTHPIKGTRPRDPDPVVDAALAAELRASEKERAENVMIVDLMRNDLSQVCVPGSIRVDRLWAVESYPAVHQLVSAVSGTPRAGTTVAQLLQSAFPAGSMTGAPKLSAMTILHRLEGGGPRGVYSGCFGYVGLDGRLDLAMVIRSILVDDARAVVGAGGGITWRSDAAAEVAEVAIKARAPLAALGAALPERWRQAALDPTDRA